MSGGHFNYTNDTLCSDIYGWGLCADYGEKGVSNSSLARKINPFEDAEISELIYDVFCLIHSYDWYTSGDIDKADYLKDVGAFKKKWLRATLSQQCKRQIDLDLEACKSSLYQIFGVSESVQDGENS